MAGDRYPVPEASDDQQAQEGGTGALGNGQRLRLRPLPPRPRFNIPAQPPEQQPAEVDQAQFDRIMSAGGPQPPPVPPQQPPDWRGAAAASSAPGLADAQPPPQAPASPQQWQGFPGLQQPRPEIREDGSVSRYLASQQQQGQSNADRILGMDSGGRQPPPGSVDPSQLGWHAPQGTEISDSEFKGVQDAMKKDRLSGRTETVTGSGLPMERRSVAQLMRASGLDSLPMSPRERAALEEHMQNRIDTAQHDTHKQGIQTGELKVHQDKPGHEMGLLQQKQQGDMALERMKLGLANNAALQQYLQTKPTGPELAEFIKQQASAMAMMGTEKFGAMPTTPGLPAAPQASPGTGVGVRSGGPAPNTIAAASGKKRPGNVISNLSAEDWVRQHQDEARNVQVDPEVAAAAAKPPMTPEERLLADTEARGSLPSKESIANILAQAHGAQNTTAVTKPEDLNIASLVQAIRGNSAVGDRGMPELARQLTTERGQNKGDLIRRLQQEIIRRSNEEGAGRHFGMRNYGDVSIVPSGSGGQQTGSGSASGEGGQFRGTPGASASPTGYTIKGAGQETWHPMPGLFDSKWDRDTLTTRRADTKGRYRGEISTLGALAQALAGLK